MASRAAAQNQQYVELMDTPPFSHAAQIAHQNPLNLDFARYRESLLALGLRDEISADREHVRSAEAQRHEIEHCGAPQATPACQVQIRYIYQILRGYSPEQVFAQSLLGFETVQQTIDAHEPGFLGINFVMPEDGFLSMRDYTLQMKMQMCIRDSSPIRRVDARHLHRRHQYRWNTRKPPRARSRTEPANLTV